ncbi:MAG: hypothetical protein K2Q09_02345, partial [Phycisphaerales bacterium]|nr:hypothetical protein [Phycisphaerales bacterium]
MRTAIILAALAGAPAVTFAQPFHYAVNQAGSSMTFNISYTAPFQTPPAGSSYIVGTRAGPDAVPGNADDILPPAAGSRTVPGLFGGDVNGNAIINLTSGSLSASGNNNSSPLRPAGAFDANFNLGLLTASVSNLNADLLGGGTATISANASIAYSSFREREPTCTIISLGPISVPVGNITATALT